MAGSGKELKGSLKEGVGRLTGDIDLEFEGKAEAKAGREQSR